MASVGETKESNEASDSPARAQSNADYLDGPWRAWSTGKNLLSITPGYLTSFSVVIGTFIVQFYVVGVVRNGIMNQVPLDSHNFSEDNSLRGFSRFLHSRVAE